MDEAVVGINITVLQISDVLDSNMYSEYKMYCHNAAIKTA